MSLDKILHELQTISGQMTRLLSQLPTKETSEESAQREEQVYQDNQALFNLLMRIDMELEKVQREFSASKSIKSKKYLLDLIAQVKKDLAQTQSEITKHQVLTAKK